MKYGYGYGKYENDGFPVMYLIARGAHGGAGLTVRAHLTLLLWTGIQKIFFVRKRQLFEQKLSMKMRRFNYWLTRNKTP